MFTKHIHFSAELENAVIGGFILESSAFAKCFGILKKECFYDLGNQIVFNAMAEMYDLNHPVDFFTVADHIIRVKNQTEIFGKTVHYFLACLTNQVVSCAHIEFHCMIIKRMWAERELIKITTGGFQGGNSINASVNKIKSELSKLVGNQSKNDWQDMSDLMYNLMMHQKKIEDGGMVFLETGIKSFDEANGGFSNTDFIIIAARPSVGKSAFMGQIAMNIAAKGKKVGIISLEMSNNQIAARLASLDTNIDFKKIYRSLFEDENEKAKFFNRIANSATRLPIYISDETSLSPSAIRAKAEKLKATLI